MRITSLVAAVAMASSGCVTATALSLVGPSANANDDAIGPIMVGGMFVDGVVMTSLGAGALDGHSSVGWSRGEGEWAMAGGITLLVIDAAVITVLLIDGGHHDDDAAPARPPRRQPPPPPPIPTGVLLVHATLIPGYGGVAIVGSPSVVAVPHIGESVTDAGNDDGWMDFEHTKALDYGEYRACAVYARRETQYVWSIFQHTIDLVSCTTVQVDAANVEVTIPPPTISSPR